MLVLKKKETFGDFYEIYFIRRFGEIQGSTEEFWALYNREIRGPILRYLHSYSFIIGPSVVKFFPRIYNAI